MQKPNNQQSHSTVQRDISDVRLNNKTQPDNDSAAKLKKHLKQSDALKTINHRLTSDSHLVFDAGNCAAAAAHYVTAPENNNASIALGMGGMGYGVASAIGVQLARLQRSSGKIQPTTVFCGDGAFLMNGFEIHTAVELGLPILWIVFNNNKHGMCMTRQQQYFANRVTCSTFTTPISIADVCRGFGSDSQLWVGKARDVVEITQCLDDFDQQQLTKPGVLELEINVEEIPPFVPFIAQHQQTQALSRSKSVQANSLTPSPGQEKEREPIKETVLGYSVA